MNPAIPTDRDLLLLLQQKDEKALSHLYDLYAASVYGLLLTRLQNENLASEILHRTFVKIWNECLQVDCAKQRLFTWVLSLTYKTALSDFQINLHAKNTRQNISV